MLKYFVGLFLMGSVAQATYFPGDCPLKIANRCYTQKQLDRFESGTLSAGGGAILTSTVTVASHVSGFHTQAGVDFQVPSGTTASCTGFRSSVGSGTSLGAYNIGLSYNDNPLPQDSGAYGVNPVIYGGGAATTYNAFVTNQTPTENTLLWTIPSLKYPAFTVDGVVTNLTMWCLIN